MQTSANSFKKIRSNACSYAASNMRFLLLIVMGAIGTLSALCGTAPAFALTALDVRDGSTSTARISIKDSTRIKVEGVAVKDIYGDVRSDKNQQGRLIVSTDPSKGELFVKPSSGSTSPINVFISTDKATYTLILLPADIPADTVVLKDKQQRVINSEGMVEAPSGRSSAYVRQLKSLMVAMATDQVESGMSFVDVNQSIQMWNEANTTLMRKLETSGRCQGEHYNVREKLGKPMRLDEREFYTKNVAAVAIDQMDLLPYAATNVYVIRCGAQ